MSRSPSCSQEPGDTSERISSLDDSSSSEKTSESPESDGSWPIEHLRTLIIVTQIPMHVDIMNLVALFLTYGELQELYLCDAKKGEFRKQERMARFMYRNEDDAWKVWVDAQKKLIKYGDEVLAISLLSDDRSPVRVLPDVCLRKIFGYLEYAQDKFHVEMVCKFWKDNGRCAWSNITKMGTHLDPFRWPLETWHVIISRVGNYLQHVELNVVLCRYAYLAAVAKHCIHLKVLKLNIRYVHYELYSTFLRIIILKNLALRHLEIETTGVQVPNVHFLDVLPRKMETIVIRKSEANSVGLDSSLGRFKELRKLALEGFRIYNPGVFDGVVNLQSLSLTECYIENHTFTALMQKNPGLTHLNLNSNQLGRGVFARVQELPNLQVLEVRAEDISNPYLANLPRLKDLNCTLCLSITDSGIKDFFNSARDLEHACFYKCSITMQAVDIARAWTERTGRPLDLYVDTYLFYQCYKSGGFDTDRFRVFNYDLEQLCGSRRSRFHRL